MYNILRTHGAHKDFLSLVHMLDAELARVDGDEHVFYHQYNSVDAIKHAVVLYQKGEPAACGAIKAFGEDAVEVKRMYTVPHHRGLGLASQVLAVLENWAVKLGYCRTVLETGKRLPQAIALYKKHGYRIIDNYGQYAGIANSVCFEKMVTVP